MMHRLFHCGFCFALLLALSQPALAAFTNVNRLKEVEASLAQRKAEAEELARRQQEESSNLSGLKQKLIATSEGVTQKQDEQKLLQDKQDELGDDIKDKSKALDVERRKLARLVTALIDLSRRPPESFILQDGQTADHIHRAMYVRAILPRVREQSDVLNSDLKSLNELKKRMAEQERLTKASAKNLAEQRQKLDQLMRAREGLLQRTEEQKADIQRQLAVLSSEAKDLRQLLERVTPKPSRKSLAQKDAPRSLKWPVSGPQIRQFGDKDSDGVRSEGIAFAALSGAPVVAPLVGRVVFAGPFRGYGSIVILQHKGGYHSFLAGFGRIDVEMGEEVDMGEPLGVMPVKSDGKPELYFEWRRNSEPVDPARGRRG
jgi:septal ring factor EnvC (AmiA/AmiB activator)